MKKTEAVRLAEIQRDIAREKFILDTIRAFICSPIVQMVGTVGFAEYAQSKGWLSDTWAGALEGGVIAMVGLQALKDTGILGAASLGLGIGGGALAGEWKNLPAWQQALISPIGAIWQGVKG